MDSLIRVKLLYSHIPPLKTISLVFGVGYTFSQIQALDNKPCNRAGLSGKEGLNVGTAPTFKMQNVGVVPTFEMHDVRIVPGFKMHNIQNPMFYDIFFSLNLNSMSKINVRCCHPIFI